MLSLNIAIVSFALLLRIMVGFHPHSGQDDYQGPTGGGSGGGDGERRPNPKYGGDYEAQRHWMEITYHLPIGEWYHHDLEYWGLDYPPLTAYHSWLCGWVAHRVGSIHDGPFGEDAGETMMDGGVCEWDDSVCIDRIKENNRTGRKSPRSKGLGVLKDLVALHSSRWGFEDSRGKSYMRFTVLFFDLLVYMSGVFVLVGRLTKDVATAETEAASMNEHDDPIIPVSQRPRVWLLLTALFQPALILVDHGHFQYNCMSLGLALWSFHFMTISESSFLGPVLGSILFSLALNFKQMELYHAPAVFAYLLGRCFRRNKNNNRSAGMETASKFCVLGLVVILTFSILWLPFAIYPRGMAPSSKIFHLDGIEQVIKRLFPFNRGIFEGKVANLWCALSVKPFSIRDWIPTKLLPLAALGLTSILILPPCWILFKAGKDDSFACGEGAIGDTPPLQSNRRQTQKDDGDSRLLLWGTASTSLAFFLASFQVHEKGILIALAPLSLLALDAPRFVSFFSIVATWSLWPLLVIDRLSDAYICCLVIYLCIDSMAKVPSSQFPSHTAMVDIFSDGYITKYFPALSWIAMISLHLSEWAIVPPHHLPDLFPVLWSLVGCGFFCISFLATVWSMMIIQTKSNKMIAEKQELSRKRVKSKTILPPISVLLGLLLLVETGETFCPTLPCSNWEINIATNTVRLHASGKRKVAGIITEDLLERARIPLSWEVQSANEAKPVLDLSARFSDTLPLAEGAAGYTSPSKIQVTKGNKDDSDESWVDGHVWQETEQHLVSLGFLTEQASGKVLCKAPQLLRLPTPQVAESASYLLSVEMDPSLVEMDPSLLTYLADDLQYGLEVYLPNMMFMGNQTAAVQMIQTQLTLAPSMAVQLVRMGVTGGLDERQVSRALGSAASASGKAVEGVVGEMGRRYREWKRIKGGKDSLG